MRTTIAAILLLLLIVVPGHTQSPPREGWIVFEPEDKAFSLSFPGLPKTEVEVTKSGPFDVTSTSIALRHASDPSGGYAVQILVPDAALAATMAASPKGPLDNMGQSDAPYLVYERPMTWRGLTGKETLVYRDAWIRKRFFWTGTRMYCLFTSSSTRNDTDPDATYFLDSLVIN